MKTGSLPPAPSPCCSGAKGTSPVLETVSPRRRQPGPAAPVTHTHTAGRGGASFPGMARRGRSARITLALCVPQIRHSRRFRPPPSPEGCGEGPRPGGGSGASRAGKPLRLKENQTGRRRRGVACRKCGALRAGAILAAAPAWWGTKGPRPAVERVSGGGPVRPGGCGAGRPRKQPRWRRVRGQAPAPPSPLAALRRRGAAPSTGGYGGAGGRELRQPARSRGERGEGARWG